MAEKKSKLVEIKTKATSTKVEDVINKITEEQKRKDSFALLEILQRLTGEKPVIWGSSIIGFGNKRYKSPATGREVDWFKIGFAPRKANLTVYLMNMQEHAEALKKLGKHKIGGGCLYINKLQDVDLKILEGMLKVSLKGK